MPNYVSNRLVISGSREELERFVEANRSDESDDGLLDFNQLAPMPAEILDAPPEPTTTFPAWHGWRLENWGTKWNALSAELEGDPRSGEIAYRFETAWSPPDGWLAAASASFPSLKIHHEYVEELLHFAGKGDWLAGDIVHHIGVDPEEIDWVEIVEFEDE